MPTFTPFVGHYVNHIGSCRHPVTGVVYAAVTYHPNGQGPFNLQIWSHDPPYTNPPIKVREWPGNSPEVPGAFGYCTLECMFDGSLWIGAAGGVDSASQTKAAWRVEPGICAPFQPQGVGATDTAAIEALQRQLDELGTWRATLELELANLGTGGGYPAEDKELVDRLRRFMRPLLGA